MLASASALCKLAHRLSLGLIAGPYKWDVLSDPSLLPAEGGLSFLPSMKMLAAAGWDTPPM